MSSINSYAISIVLPMIAIIVSMMTYWDSIQERIDEAMLQEVLGDISNFSDLRLVAEQLQYRVDIFGQTTNLITVAVHMALLFIIPMLIFYFFKMNYEKTIHFLMDYKECIEKIEEEKKKGLKYLGFGFYYDSHAKQNHRTKQRTL